MAGPYKGMYDPFSILVTYEANQWIDDRYNPDHTDEAKRDARQRWEAEHGQPPGLLRRLVRWVLRRSSN